MSPNELIDDLLPCPFCGAEAKQGEYKNYVECSNKECPVRPAAKYYESNSPQAIKDWNTRTYQGNKSISEVEAIEIVENATTNTRGFPQYAREAFVAWLPVMISALRAAGVHFRIEGSSDA